MRPSEWMETRLPHLPVSAFSIVMGLSGLAIAFFKFYHLQWLPRLPYDVSLAAASVFFLLVFPLYALKAGRHWEGVLEEYHHPVRVNFFATFSISLLLLSIAYYSRFPLLAIPLWWAGALLQTASTLLILRQWIERSLEIKDLNPAWFIPIVGNILVPVVGVDLAPKPVSMFYFAVGMTFWVVLLSILFHRLLFHPSPPAKLLPTLFIFIAPPAVGFIAYVRIANSWDPLSQSLLYLAWFFTLLLATMADRFTRLPYALSWWAYTFPLAAVTVATTVAYQITLDAAFARAAALLLAATALVDAAVLLATLKHIRAGDICVPEH